MWRNDSMIWFKTFILIHIISHVSTFEASSSNSNVDFIVELPKPIAPMNFEELDGSAKPRKLKWITDKTKNPTMVDLALEVAAKEGINAMTDLYHNIEPQIVKNGQILEENHPAALLSKFSAPAEGNERSAMAAFATLSATKAFRRNNRDSAVLGRQAQSQKVSFRRTPLEGLCPPRDPPTCMPASQRYRTHDGTCNNRRRLRWGSAQMPFNRFLPPEYGDGVDSIRGSVEGGSLSSARFVSLLVHGAREGEAPLTLMIVQWGQLLDHDMTSTTQPRSINGSVPSCCGAKDFHPLCFPIKVPLDDPWLAPLKVRCLEFLRSAPAQRRDCVLSWREQTNQVTSYIDASPIYSSSAKTSDNARIFRNGLLIYGRGDPADDVCMRGAIAHQCIRSGDGRSGEQPGLLALHHVWVGEHNRIAMELSILNPHWSDEKVYQETRRIIGALFQHITFREFLPIVLGREVCKLFDLDLMKSGYYTGYDPNINPTVSNAFAAAAFRFGHSLVQNTYMRCDRNHNFINNNVTLHEEFQQGDIGTAGSLHRLLRGLATQRALKRDEFITPELTNHLFQTPGFPFGLDLAAINIQRGRDHGIAPYTAWRQPCGLSAINTWDDLSNIVGPESAKRISHAYQNVHDIDLFVGGIAERPVIGGLVGPTFACIIAQQFSNSRKGDRFWYENAGFESSFTPAQLNSLRRVSLSSVLCRAINGGTLQPYVFLPNEAKGNQRIKCGTDSLEPIDLKPWLEQDPFFINNDKIDQNSPLHDTPISTAPMTTTKEEKGINNRIQNVTMVANVDFIPNSSIGFHRVANMTKIHDKLDMAQKLVTRPVSKPLRGISNKLDNKQRQTVKNKVKPTASSLSKRISTTRRTVVIHNVQIELRSAAGEVKKDQKYKKKPTNEQENSDLASTAKKTILKVADVVKSQISAAMGFLSNDNDDDDDTSPKHLPRKLNDPNKTNQPTKHSERWQEIEQIYSDSETKAKETQTLTQARNSNNEIEALSDSDISTKTSNSTVTKTNQTILTNLTKNSTTETEYKQPNVYENTDMERATDILSTNTLTDIESSTHETLLGEENNVKYNQNLNSQITSKENYETQTEPSNDTRAKPVHITRMTASELTKLTNRLKNDIPTKASQILVSDDKQTLAQSGNSNLKIEVLNDSDILNITSNNTTTHTTTILTNLINNSNRKQTETEHKQPNVINKNSDTEVTTGIINTNDIESFTDEHPLEEKENLTVKKDSTNQFLTIQLKVPQQHDNPQTEPKNDISTKTSYFTPKPMTVDDPSQLNTTLTLITYRPKAENMTITRNTTYDTNIPSIDKPVTDPSEKLAEPHETYNDFQAIINSALHDSLDQHKRVHRKTVHKNVNVKEVELHAHNLDFTDKLRTLRIDRSNEYDEHQQLTGSGEFQQTPDTKFDEHYFADLDDSTLPINTEQSATLRNVEHRQFPERPIYNRPQKVILDAPDSDQYEIEINIRQTNTKPPHKYGNYQDFNNPNKRYDTDRYNQNYDYKDPQENTPSDSFFTQTTRIPYGKRTKPPTIIYIDEHDDRTSTRTPGLFQNIISFATNSFNGIRQQTTSTESPFNHKPNRISNNDASDDYLSPHSSRPYKPSSENYQQAQSYPPNQAFPPPGFPQVPPNFTPSAVATASAPPQGFPPPNIYHPQSLPGANSFSTATTINGVSHASSNAVSTGHFGAIAGSASSSGGDSTFSFNIRPSARPHLNLMKPSSIKPPDYELLPQHQRPQFSSTPNYAYPPKPMPSVESFQYPPNKHDPFSSYTRRPPQYYNKYPSNVFDPAYEDIGRSELKLDEISKSDSKTNKTRDIPNFDSIEYDYNDDDIDSFVSGIFKNDNSDPQKSSDNDKIDYLKLAEQVLTNRTKLNVTEINDNFVLPVLRKSDKYIESDLSLTDNANTMEQKSVNHGILAEDYDELLTGRASLIDSKTSLITGEWNRLEKPLLNEPVAFAPIQILTKPERPDNWVIYNASDDKPQVLDQPEFITETQSAAEVPMPIQKRKKASRVPITSKRSKDENFTVENVNFDTTTTLKSEVSLDIIDTTTTDEFITSSDLLEELNETSTITEDAQLVTNAEILNEEIDNENMVLTETPYDELTTLPNLT